MKRDMKRFGAMQIEASEVRKVFPLASHLEYIVSNGDAETSANALCELQQRAANGDSEAEAAISRLWAEA